jgi:uncharacterized membrane protein
LYYKIYIVMLMDAKQSKICRIIIIVATVALAGWFAASADPVPVVISAAAGLILFYLCKMSVEDVVADERDERVSEKAAKIAMEVFAATSAFVGVVLIALRIDHPEYTNPGFALAFSACALMILYSVLYGYYNRRYGYEPCDEE